MESLKIPMADIQVILGYEHRKTTESYRLACHRSPPGKCRQGAGDQIAQ